MSIGQYLKKKKEDFDQYRETKRQSRELQERLDLESDIEEGKVARTKLAKYKQAEKARADVKRYNEYKGGSSNPFKAFSMNMKSIQASHRNTAAGLGFSLGGDPVGKIDVGGSHLGLFPSARPRRKSTHKKKRR